MSSNIPLDDQTAEVILKKLNSIRSSVSPDRFIMIQDILVKAISRKFFTSKDIYDILALLEDNIGLEYAEKAKDSNIVKHTLLHKAIIEKKSTNFKQTLIHQYDNKSIHNFKRALVLLLISHSKRAKASKNRL